MALIKCPECGKEVSDKAAACIYCGYPLSPEGTDPATAQLTAIPPESGKTAKQKSKPITKLVNRLNPGLRIAISALLIILSIVFLVQGKNTITSDRYEFYKEHYQDCIDGYDDAMSSANSSGAMFRSTYKSIADDYQRMAKDDLAKLNSMRAKAAIFYVLFAVCLILIVILLRGVDIKQTFKAAFSGEASSIEDKPSDSPDKSKDFPDKEEPPVEDSPVDESPTIGQSSVDDSTSETPEIQDNPAKPRSKKPWIIGGSVLVLVAVLLLGTTVFDKKVCAVEGCNIKVTDENSKYCNVHTCRDVFCYNKVVKDGHYCSTHTCNVTGCTEPIKKSYYSLSSGDNKYCETHQTQYDKAVSTSNLEFSDIKIEHNSSYTVCTGKVTNYGLATYKFVTIKGSFVNSSGSTCDTDSTYAVGSEGLAPGESTTFRMSIPRDRNVKDCKISITDYDISSVNTYKIFS